MVPIKDFRDLKKNLKENFLGLKQIRVALLGDTATQFLNQALKATGFDHALNLDIWEADYNQIERQIFDPASALYEFKPDVVILFKSSYKLLLKYNKLSAPDQHNLAADELNTISSLITHLNARLKAQILMYNYTEIDDKVFGNFTNKTASSFLFQLRKLNYELMNYSVSEPALHLLDISSLQNKVGKDVFFNPSIYINTDMVLSLDVLPAVAAITLDTIDALAGKFKKCIVLDLDNTLWGGIIGDDGLEHIQLGSLGIGKAFTEFQYWLKKLKHRGIILAVCSKNTEAVAKEPFINHPDMPLRLDDIAVFVANWETKVDNIRHIQKILNIGFDSMVFLDDNPFERNIVRENIPLLTVPELPEDPALYLEYLYTLNLFETVSFSEEDTERTKQYQTEAKRIAVQQSFTNEADFLKSLDMRSLIEPFNKYNKPRVAQLSQRSNQFNLRTIRYTEADVEQLIISPDSFSFAFTLTDKYGDNGLISLIVLKKQSETTLFIESWLMSCRVLKRGMERFVLNALARFAHNNGYAFLKGEYIPTAKNEMVKDHYRDLGFSESNGYWILKVEDYEFQKECYIKQIGA